LKDSKPEQDTVWPSKYYTLNQNKGIALDQPIIKPTAMRLPVSFYVDKGDSAVYQRTDDGLPLQVDPTFSNNIYKAVKGLGCLQQTIPPEISFLQNRV